MKTVTIRPALPQERDAHELTRAQCLHVALIAVAIALAVVIGALS